MKDWNWTLIFSGMLAVSAVLQFIFAAVLTRTNRRLVAMQESFQIWQRDLVDSRENAELVGHGQVFIRRVPAPDRRVHIEFSMSNPGRTLVNIEVIEFAGEVPEHTPIESVAWRSLFPLLSQSMNVEDHWRAETPIPIFPGGLCRLRSSVVLASEEMVEKVSQLESVVVRLSYRVGNGASRQQDYCLRKHT